MKSDTTLDDCIFLTKIFPFQAAKMMKELLIKINLRKCYICKNIIINNPIDIMIDKECRKLCEKCFIKYVNEG